MALELVGGAFLSASLQMLFDRMASREMVDFIKGKKLNKRLFEELEIMLLPAKEFLNDAEQKQIGNQTVRAWLHKLQAAVYDAEDLVQLINTEALRCKIEAQYKSRSSHHQVRKLFSRTSTASFNKNVESKMKEILDTLKLILDKKVHLGLKGGIQTLSSKRLPATSFVEESGVCGRDDEKEAIIKSLLTADDGSGSKISVIPIVGMGGIGKTTLAKLIYNDERVEKCFDLRAWISVSNVFDVIKITKTIAEKLTFQDFNTQDLDRLQDELMKALKGKKFFLVLDDVWNENYLLWEELKMPFEYGAYGSKIIVTTRNEIVARTMRSNIPSYHLDTMSEENCWKLFVHHAFNNVDPCANPKLEEIGKQIVTKCKGLPLAVKSLGSILRYQLNSEEWKNVLKSDIWELPEEKNNILPALWLSYHHLPSHLKRCFAYCSVFPKNYIIKKEDLILLWMAQDLLIPNKKKRIEEVGEEFCYELWSRSIFQKSAYPGHESICYTMHDLVHDLATFIAGEFLLSLDDSDSANRLCQVRHLSHEKDDEIYDSKKYEHLVKAKCLRTFFFPSRSYGDQIQWQLEKLEAMKLWSTLTYLRSLSFRGCSIKKLPDSIGNLKLLRYLNLSSTEITEVPDTVCSLSNLQTLILSYCRALKLLPSEMGRLINLRHLDIGWTRVKSMPLKMGNLKNLQTLTDFFVGKSNGSTINSLKDLQNLRGSLCFSGLENAVKVEDVLEANLKEKKYLTEIEFSWRYDVSCNNSREVLNGLEPHTSLKDLVIRCYGGEEFPKWVGDPSFCNLEKIHLVGYRECRMLPPLGQLPFLKDLKISGFYEVVKVGDEFYCGDCSVPTRPFRSLNSLHIEFMGKCEEWSFINGEDGDAAFPELEIFRLTYCPRLNAHICFPSTIKEVRIHGCKKLELSGMQQHCYRNLTELSIKSVEFLIDSIALDYYFTMCTSLTLESCVNLKSLTYSQQPPATLSLKLLNLRFCPNLESFPKGGLHAPNLEELKISDCEKLKSLPENMQTLSLKRFNLRSCPNLESFPKGGLHAPNLEEMEISDCEKLKSLPENMQTLSLKRFNLRSCPNLESFPKGGLHAPNLEEMEISDCEKLKSLPENMQTLSLKRLNLRSCPNLESFPKGGLHAPNLEKLEISYCEKLKSLPENMQTLLPSLQTLSLLNCPEVESFPEFPMPCNLRQLQICECDKLLASRRHWNLSSLTSLSIESIDEVLDSFPEEGLLPTTLVNLTIRSLPHLKALNGEALRHLSSLKELHISDCDELQCLPEEGLLPTTLIKLRIYKLPHLKALNGKALQRLSSLEELQISHCKELQCLPEEGLPASLFNLVIVQCPLLKQRCQRFRGEDWSKIAHIHHIKID